MLAHVATSVTGTELGTSYAAPRTAADAASMLVRNGSVFSSANSQSDVAKEIISWNSQSPNAVWDPRFGYGAITS